MKWSDIFRRKLVRNILLLIPGIVAENIVNALVKQGTVAASILGRLITIYLIVIIIMICGSALQAISEHYAQQGKKRNIPLKGIFQALQILTYFIGGLVIVAVLLNKSPGVLLTTGCGSVWLEHLVWDQGVAGSNPVTPIEK